MKKNFNLWTVLFRGTAKSFDQKKQTKKTTTKPNNCMIYCKNTFETEVVARSRLERSPRKRKVECSNSSNDRPKS